ncbi:winged helix-turn-helix domain-containing protein [Beijerinckia mobilis]|uniref:winged helix-turn-helix domain-containing protein n=1 Tax=Beijerinckia mobilis TaxID=231434 RepID=UPI00068B3386|nr:winged helix-turn-helix domain-containing protein [Beijerinckia mobilis]
MPIPPQAVVENALLDLLFEASRPVRAKDTYNALAKKFELTDEEYSITRKDGRNTWQNLIQWARLRLVNKGLIDKSVRGLWNLSDLGRSIAAQRSIDAAASISPDTIQDGCNLFMEMEEGQLILHTHFLHERSSTLINAFKQRLNHYVCQVCDFDFEATYGELGQGYIEAHHTIPVASLVTGMKTRLSDLVPLCANCHRIIHRNGLIPIDALKAAIKKRKEQ